MICFRLGLGNVEIDLFALDNEVVGCARDRVLQICACLDPGLTEPHLWNTLA
jgi:hypothetical protein